MVDNPFTIVGNPNNHYSVYSLVGGIPTPLKNIYESQWEG